jgi:hypothetical protein
MKYLPIVVIYLVKNKTKMYDTETTFITLMIVLANG